MHRFHLARLMSEVMVRAVLDRIPDYRVDVETSTNTWATRA